MCPIFGKKRIGFLILLLIGFSLTTSQAASVGDYDFPFDKNYDYDIFINSGQSSATVIESVQILNFQDIAGRKFLVVRSREFKLQDTTGLIALDSVMAILPHRSFRVRNARTALELP